MRKVPANDNSQELDNLVGVFNRLNGNLGITCEEQWIYFGLILSRFQKTTLTLDELQSKPPIKRCLESKFNKE